MYLVTGATGVIGRPLVEALLAQGAQVRAVTRDPQNAELPPGVQAVAPEAIHAALRGVRGLFVHPRAAKNDIAELLRLAADRGVEKVVVVRSQPRLLPRQ